MTTPTVERSIEALLKTMQFINGMEKSDKKFNIDNGNNENFRIEYIDQPDMPITPRATIIKHIEQ